MAQPSNTYYYSLSGYLTLKSWQKSFKRFIEFFLLIDFHFFSNQIIMLINFKKMVLFN